MSKQSELDELAFRLYRLKYNQLGGGAQELLVEVLDWHNKQVEEVLDRLEQADAKLTDGRHLELDIPSWVEAERNKLKADPRLHYHGQGWPAACTLDHKLKESK